MTSCARSRAPTLVMARTACVLTVNGDTDIWAAISWLSRPLATSTITVDGPAAAAIVDHARSWGADLVVVGTRGNGLLKRLLLGSTARSVMHRAQSSVLITKPTTGVDREAVPSADPVEAVPA